MTEHNTLYERITNVNDPRIVVGATLIMLMDHDNHPDAFDTSIIIDINNVTDTDDREHPRYDDQITLCRPHAMLRKESFATISRRIERLVPYVQCEVFTIERSKLKYFALVFTGFSHEKVDIRIHDFLDPLNGGDYVKVPQFAK